MRTHARFADKKGLYWAPALREALAEGYDRVAFRSDLLAGITVGIIAVPLAMALAIASGVPPQHGLYTAIIAGGIIAVLGGTRLGIAGPTAAFVVLLQPIATTYGLEGLLIATMLAGVIQILLGLSRLGYLVQFVPYPVTTGFTTGIGTVIAFLQIPDLFGLQIAEKMPEAFISKMYLVGTHLLTVQPQEACWGLLTLGLLLLWKRTGFQIPGHLPVLLGITLLATAMGSWDPQWEVATLGKRFHYTWEGQIFPGIPHFLPAPHWPTISWSDVVVLIQPAIGLALLGAIESLLCAVVADGFSGTKHYPNSELIAQGIGNVVAPLFGGITATNAIARTTANIRSGAKSPLAAGIHSLTVLLCMVVFAPYLAWVPMSALAGILVFVAYQMADLKHFTRVMRRAPGADKMVLWVCFLLTVFFDMVLAVGVGMVLASFLFMQRMISVSGVSLADPHSLDWPDNTAPVIPPAIKIYRINGPLFFGAAEKAIEYLKASVPDTQIMILLMKHVPTVDMTAFVALESLLEELRRHGIHVIMTGLKPTLKKRLHAMGLADHPHLSYAHQFNSALAQAKKLLGSAGVVSKR